ncbi:DUF1737 domain-containing protein [Lactococcus petauri]|uniref:DUF1737 domain-containing protein n=1 Tax=Lactococcus petauri TaxID=1940789 RepID=UPI00254E55B6|nr:DUF1737 domain-containing protein [Lactococcus petauri]
MEYKIIDGSNTAPKTFEMEVSQALYNGWKLQGGIAVTEVGPDAYYYQAVVKE